MVTVTELRKEGKLDDAEALARELLAQDPENYDHKREMAWVLHTRAKKHVEKGDATGLIDWLRQIRGLNLNLQEEKTMGNAVGWLIHKASKKFTDKSTNRHDLVLDLLDEAMHYTYDTDTQPNPYSFLLRNCFKVKDSYPHLGSFIEWWGLDNLAPEDFEPYVHQGRKLMSTAEQAYVTYARTLLEQPDSPELHHRMSQWEKQIDALLEEYPELVQPKYSRARLLTRLGRYEEVSALLIPHLRNNQAEFWAWVLLADAQVHYNIAHAMSSYSRALLCNTRPEFIVAVKEKFIKLLIDQQNWNFAATELDDIEFMTEKIGMPMKPEWLEMKETEWFKNAEKNRGNRRLYTKLAAAAEDFLFAHLQWEIGLITDIDTVKGFARFIVDKEKSGTIKLTKLPRDVKVGQVYRLRLQPQTAANGDVWYKAISSQQTDFAPSAEVAKAFSGILNVREPNRFGFVNSEIFVMDSLIQKELIGQWVSGMAVASYNAKKGTWGWRAISLGAE